MRDEMTPQLRRIFDVSKLQTAANFVSALAIRQMQERTSRGQFLGGKLAEKGYSTNPLPAFYLGDVTYLGGGAVSVKPARAAAVKFSDSELDWKRSGAMVLGGYKAMREKSGRETSRVTLTYSGAMLNSLRGKVTALANTVRIAFGVDPDQEEKAYFTNLQREWLSLSDNEQAKIAAELERKLI